RADELVGDAAVAADHEALRHAVDTPFDRGAAVLVGARRRERIAVAVEKPAGVVGLILVIDADEADPGILRELLQERHLVVTRHAPGGPDVDQGDATLELDRVAPGPRL